MQENKFIVIEGIDGAGKSTVTKKLFELYPQDCAVFVEPTRVSPYAGALRGILTGKTREDVSELLILFKKDRLWNIQNNIEPSLRKNKITILDRYYFSTAAYQGQNCEEVQAIIDDYLDNEQILQPDYVFYLRLRADQALERISKRGEAQEIFEKKSRLNKIVENYDYLFSKMDFTFPCFIVDAGSKQEDIIDFIIQKIFLR